MFEYADHHTAHSIQHTPHSTQHRTPHTAHRTPHTAQHSTQHRTPHTVHRARPQLVEQGSSLLFSSSLPLFSSSLLDVLRPFKRVSCTREIKKTS